MKNITISILFLATVTGAMFGQSSYVPDSVRYVTEEDVAYRLHDETNSLFKLGPLGYEHKIGEAFSLSAGIVTSNLFNGYFLNTNAGVGIEARYYYQMKERIASGKQASNLSGKYVSITPSIGIGLNFRNINNNPTLNTGLTSAVNLAVSEQTRMYRWFFWDRGVQIEYLKYQNQFPENTIKGITISRRSNVGICFGGGKLKNNPLDMGPEVKVNVNEKYALRLVENDNILVSTIQANSIPGTQWRILLIPILVSELKLGNSAFSLINEFTSRIEFSNFQDITPTPFEARRILYSARVGTRWYYNMKQKVLSGQQGNNFSGGYIVANVAYNNSVEKGSDLTFITAGWGYQKEVGRKFFINVDLTAGALVNGTRPDSQNFVTTHIPGGRLTINIGRRLF